MDKEKTIDISITIEEMEDIEANRDTKGTTQWKKWRLRLHDKNYPFYEKHGATAEGAEKLRGTIDDIVQSGEIPYTSFKDVFQQICYGAHYSEKTPEFTLWLNANKDDADFKNLLIKKLGLSPTTSISDISGSVRKEIADLPSALPPSENQ